MKKYLLTIIASAIGLTFIWGTYESISFIYANLTTKKTTTTMTTTTTTFYHNCSEVKAAGKAPLRRGEPGYLSKLDRDGDGIACE